MENVIRFRKDVKENSLGLVQKGNRGGKSFILHLAYAIDVGRQCWNYDLPKMNYKRRTFAPCVITVMFHVG